VALRRKLEDPIEPGVFGAWFFFIRRGLLGCGRCGEFAAPPTGWGGRLGADFLEEAPQGIGPSSRQQRPDELGSVLLLEQLIDKLGKGAFLVALGLADRRRHQVLQPLPRNPFAFGKRRRRCNGSGLP